MRSMENMDAILDTALASTTWRLPRWRGDVGAEGEGEEGELAAKGSEGVGRQ